MRLSDIRENASAGSTTSANMGTTIAGGTPPKGQFFGGDPAASIYTTIKKHRKARKEKVEEALESLYWTVAKKLYKEYSNDIRDERTDTPLIYDLAIQNGCSKDEAWEVVESFFKLYHKWGPSIGYLPDRKKLREETKTAKTPKKPSGKAEVIGGSKPYKQPNVLSPTMKVKSTGKMLGGAEKKNPTLSTKFFGTCSANNDPGDKSIIAELSYKEFRNASKAISKICPICKQSFKNIHDVNQQFCSQECELQAKTVAKLKDVFDRGTFVKK